MNIKQHDSDGYYDGAGISNNYCDVNDNIDDCVDDDDDDMIVMVIRMMLVLVIDIVMVMIILMILLLKMDQL